MSTPVAASASPFADPLSPTFQAGSTLGARLAVASRQAQGLSLAVDDPMVLNELRELCAVPRPVRRRV